MPKIHHFGIRRLRQLQRNWLKTNEHTNINKSSLSSHYLPKSKDIHFGASRWPNGKKSTKKWAKELTDISPKKTYRWLTNIWKDVQHHSFLEKCKSKLQWDIISHWSEWPSSKKSTNNKCWRGCGEKGTLLHCWWECKLVQLQRRPVESPSKTGNRTAIWPSNPSAGHTPWGNQNSN